MLELKQTLNTCRRLLPLACLSSIIPAFAQVNILTQHYDDNRSGANLSETVLTPANVNVNSFGKLFTYSVDGDVFAQPLYVSGLTIAGGTHNVLYVVTMNDKVYAFDADNNTTLWSVNLAVSPETPVPIIDIVGSNTLNIHNNVGIESTPVIDLSTNTMYLVARTINGTTYFQRLHALDLLTGAEKFGGPVNIAASVPGTGNGSSNGTLAFDPKMENQRPGLALANGEVIISWAGHEDKNPWHGWVIAYNASTLARTGAFCTTPNAYGGGIWNAGQAPSVDANGNVYVMTGNGDYNGTSDYGDSFLKFSTSSGGLNLVDWFTPDGSGSGTQTGDNPANEDAHDLDLGSAGTILIPGTTQVFGGGKLGILYLVNTQSMGHEVTGNTQIFQNFQGVTISSCGYNHIHGTPVYWNSASNGPMIYVWGENDTGKAYKYASGKFATTPASHTAATSPTTGCGMPGGILSISANGNADGILWASTVYTGNALHNNVPGMLRAFDANNLGTELWNSRMNDARDDSGTLAKYVSPTIANGKVYMPTFDQDTGASSNHINVYGLLAGRAAPPSFSPAGGTYATAQNVTLASSTAGASIRYTTDGSTPSETAGTLYSGPINIASSVTLKAIAFESGFLDSVVTSGVYTIGTGGGSSVSFEAENLVYTPNGATASVQTDANSSGGKWVELAGNSVGDYIDFAIPSVSAGTYTLQMEWKGNGGRGILQLSVDGTNIGPTLDQYAATQTYPTTTFGTVTFGSAATHTIRLTVTGKNAASTGYQLSADKFTFTLQGSSPPQVVAPAFSPAGGTYSTAQTVTITTSTGGASLRYTTDGSTPSETAGTIYSAPVSISSSATLQAIAYESGFTDSAVTSANYSIGAGAPTVSFEAENLTYTPSGATASVQTDVNSSGGKWVVLSATAAGPSISYAIPSIVAGTYTLQMEWKGNGNRGILQLAVDGANLGPVLDQYATAQTYPTTTFGTVTFSSAGTHTVKLTVTGKNTASTGYQLSADKFTFVGQ